MPDQLAQTAAGVLQLPVDEVADSTAMGQCPTWDSLTHFNLILTVESAFGVRFSSAVIPELTSIARIRQELKHLIEKSA